MELQTAVQYLAQEQDNARAAGQVVGRLLIPALGLVLLVLGRRRRSDPTRASRGTGLIVSGAVLLVLGVLGTVASVTSPGATG